MSLLTGQALGFRHGDYPVLFASTGGSAVIRAQYADITHNRPAIPVSELGNYRYAGLVADPYNATATLTFLVGGAQLGRVGSYGDNPISWMTDADQFYTVKAGIDNAMLSTYTASARVGDFGQVTINLLGLPISSGSNPSASGSPPYPAVSPIAYRAPNINVLDPTAMPRVQGFSASATINRTPLMQMGSGCVLGYAPDPPTCRLDIDIVEATSSTLPAPTIGSTLDFTIQIGALTVTVYSTVLVGVTYAGVVNGWATRRGIYMALSNDTYGGLRLT